jgi:hypothetical protein
MGDKIINTITNTSNLQRLTVVNYFLKVQGEEQKVVKE